MNPMRLIDNHIEPNDVYVLEKSEGELKRQTEYAGNSG